MLALCNAIYRCCEQCWSEFWCQIRAIQRLSSFQLLAALLALSKILSPCLWCQPLPRSYLLGIAMYRILVVACASSKLQKHMQEGFMLPPPQYLFRGLGSFRSGPLSPHPQELHSGFPIHRLQSVDSILQSVPRQLVTAVVLWCLTKLSRWSPQFNSSPNITRVMRWTVHKTYMSGWEMDKNCGLIHTVMTPLEICRRT